MRFETLSECHAYALAQCYEYGFLPVNVDDVNFDPMAYSSQQRLTGVHSIEVSAKNGKNTKKRLQIVLERFENGRYECLAYVA